MSVQLGARISPMNKTVVTPTTGQTVSFLNNGANQLLYINPAAPLLALTINLPSNATSVDTQFCFVCCTKSVGTLTVQNATTILNSPTTLLGGEFFCLFKVASNVWAQQVTV